MKVRVPVPIPPIVPIRIHGPLGTKDVDALLDTGATFCIISTDEALHLGYDLAGAVELSIATAGGLIRVPKLTVDSIEVLGFRRPRVPVLVKDLAEAGLKAIIGWSFSIDSD